MTAHQHPRKPASRPLGLPVPAIPGLALLAVPRVVLHDLGVLHEGSIVNMLFVFLPPAVWIAVVVVARVRTPFLTLFLIGVCAGVYLVICHQLLWGVAFAEPPWLGGRLAQLDPGVQMFLMRGFAVLSGLATGMVTAALTGMLGWAVSAVTRRIRDASKQPG